MNLPGLAPEAGRTRVTRRVSGRKPVALRRAAPLVPVLLMASSLVGAAIAGPLRPSGSPRIARSGDPTFAELAAVLLESRKPLTRDEVADGRTLPDPRPDPLLDLLGIDMPSGTPLARAVYDVLPQLEPGRRVDVRALALPPHLTFARGHALLAENVIIRFELGVGSEHAVSRRDRDRDGVADVIGALADDIRFALPLVSRQLGWEPEFRSPDGLLRVDVGLTPFREGITLPDTRIVIPSYIDGDDRLRAVARQLTHVALRDLVRDLPAELEEAVATFVAESVVVSEEQDIVLPALLTPDGRAPRAFLSPGLLSSRGDAGFLAYLSHVVGLPATWLADVAGDWPRSPYTTRPSLSAFCPTRSSKRA